MSIERSSPRGGRWFLLVPVFGLALEVLVALGGTAVASRGLRGMPHRGAVAPAVARSRFDRPSGGPG